MIGEHGQDQLFEQQYQQLKQQAQVAEQHLAEAEHSRITTAEQLKLAQQKLAQ